MLIAKNRGVQCSAHVCVARQRHKCAKTTDRSQITYYAKQSDIVLLSTHAAEFVSSVLICTSLADERKSAQLPAADRRPPSITVEFTLRLSARSTWLPEAASRPVWPRTAADRGAVSVASSL